MASLGKTAVFEANLGTIKSIQLSKQGPSTPVLVLFRKEEFRTVLTDVDT